MKKLSALVILLLFTKVLCAQDTVMHKHPVLPRPQIHISYGILSTDQWKGIGEGPLRSFMDVPRTRDMTGAFFITYQQFFSRRSAVSLTAGIDNQNGALSYGSSRGPNVAGGNIPRASGAYCRQAYTAAVEYSYIYHRGRRHYTYGLIGGGYTIATNKYSFYKNVTDSAAFYGPHGMIPTNPYTEHCTHWAGQITPIAYRNETRRVGMYVEFGFGYKGMICTGVSVQL